MLRTRQHNRTEYSEMCRGIDVEKKHQHNRTGYSKICRGIKVEKKTDFRIAWLPTKSIGPWYLLQHLLDHDTCYKLHSLTSKTSLKMQTLSHVQVFLHWLIKKIMGTTSCYNLHCPWLKKQAEKIKKKKQIFYWTRVHSFCGWISNRDKDGHHN